MTRLYETGTHPFYIGMYIHIYTHIYMYIYILLRRNVYVFFHGEEGGNHDHWGGHYEPGPYAILYYNRHSVGS